MVIENKVLKRIFKPTKGRLQEDGHSTLRGATYFILCNRSYLTDEMEM
jgi:hypothetical protein